MTEKRLPSFNDFSPGLFPDIREPLRAARANAGERDAIAAAISAQKGWPATNKRAKTNVLVTLQNTGLFDLQSAKLTELGNTIADAASALDAARLFCKHVLEHMNGRTLVSAVRSLNKRNEKVTKASLKAELVRLGIAKLSNATTDHLTLRNWMAAAGLLDEGANYSVRDPELKALISISSEEEAELEQLEVAQRIFLAVFRRLTLTEGASWVPARRLITECLRDYPQVFDEDQFRKKILDPLREQGWIDAEGLTGGRGAKSGNVRATPKLLGIPVTDLMPSFETDVPPDLRKRIDTPLEEIRTKLDSSSKYEKGLALELLALRMILDLSLTPRGFRRRAKSTGYAEVDVTAEGKHLLFSRWMFQCKAIGHTAKVSVEDVAREVGIAIHAKAHVVVMVSTGGFTRTATDFAREITSSTHLQFLFIDGKIVREYLKSGALKLIEYVLQNAADVMAQKGEQLALENESEEVSAKAGASED